jgi:putative ABC transport system substrate-binding protein
VELQVLEARRSEDFAGLFIVMTRDGDALLVLDDAMFAIFAPTLVDLSSKNRIPAIYGCNGFVEVGGLMSYQGNFVVVNRRAATYVDKILKGAKPDDLPVEEPTRFELAINLNAAKVLGLTIPQSLLLRADEVIQ